MKRAIDFLFSGALLGILFLVMIIAMARATFIENDFGAETAKFLVYDSWWFELLFLLMTINFAGMIFTKHLYKKGKWNVLVMHLAFVVIIIGAGITRYVGVEGMMHIRNGQTASSFLSSENYFQLNAFANDGATFESKDQLYLVDRDKSIFNKAFELDGKSVEVELKKFIPNAVSRAVATEGGKSVMTVVAAGPHGRNDYTLNEGSQLPLGVIAVNFGALQYVDHFNIIKKDGDLFFNSPFPVVSIDMNSGVQDSIDAEQTRPLKLMNIYQVQGLNMVFKDYEASAKYVYEPAPEGVETPYEATSIIITVDGIPSVITTMRESGELFHDYHGNVGGVDFEIHVGAHEIVVPFGLRLDNFILDRYPGSDSPSSYASEVTVVDSLTGTFMPYRIYMNNILNYGGYRFFQSSYDQDEQGTVLSVNKDYWGTFITYIGYGLLFLSLLLSLFIRGGRFSWLAHKLVTDDSKSSNSTIVKPALVLALIICSQTLALAQSDAITAPLDESEKFEKLLVQNNDGRIIPINTLSEQLLVKIYKKNSFKGLTATQTLLSMTTWSEEWQKVPLIRVYNPMIQNILGIASDYASFSDFIDEQGKYKLSQQVNAAYAKSAGQRNEFDKQLIGTDERANICYLIFNGNFLKIYPIPADPNNKWGTQHEYHEALEASGSIANATKFTDYVESIRSSKVTGGTNEGKTLLTSMMNYQQANGKEILPSDFKIKLEIFYNRVNIFKRLFPYYFLIGFILLGAFLTTLLKPGVELKRLVSGAYLGVLILFSFHTLGLIARWYISGHEPWSNGYESMIYIAWATILAGLIFKAKSISTTSVTCILAAITLLTAHMSWLNPEITNLVPVLKSYWLTIHVATITASYGFLALGAMLALLNLVLMVIQNSDNHKRITSKIEELTVTVEMSMIVGLVLLVIGNFLGGIWANESWGRYWGWDPKETWALITIFVYTLILHTRLIPKVKSLFSFNFMAVIGFWSVIMTYFGVNYYLSGLHSYAQGDPVPIPTAIYVVVVLILLISTVAAMKSAKFKQTTHPVVASSKPRISKTP